MKEIKLVDKEKGVFRITTVGERWYALPLLNKDSGIPEGYEYLPSSTWICGSYPKGVAFYKWLADKGWDQAEKIKTDAGARGSKVHQACEALIKGEVLNYETQFINPKTEQLELFTVEEWVAILSFKRWYEKENPEILLVERVLVSEKYGYAGTVDLVYRKDGQTVLLDIKTGQNIWPEYELQVSSYKQALIEMGLFEKIDRLEILQLGYNKNKAGYKLTEVEDKFDLFLAARQIWANEFPDERPKERDYPLQISLTKPQPKE